MTSLLTNASAITALQNLNATNKSHADDARPDLDRHARRQRFRQRRLLVDRHDHEVRQRRASTVKDALGMGVATVDVTASA